MQPNDSEPTAFDPTAQHASLGAAHWLATLTDENCTDAERQQFLDWLRASTRNVDEFLRLSTLARTASKRELWPDESIDDLVAAARASDNVASLRPTMHAPESGRRSFRWAIAASLACLVAVGAAALMSPTLTRLWRPDYRTEVGEQRSITLEDGSIVQLNSRSRLRTRYTSEARIADLIEGEAIFRVARDPQRPFSVRSGPTEIVAVGTAFNVNAETQRTIVTVLEGRVRVNRRAAVGPADGAHQQIPLQNIELTVGEQAIVAPAQPIIRVALSDTEKVTSWTQRRLIFEDTTLGAAAAQFARYSSRAIRIQDPAIAERRINGVFDATDPASLVQFLRADETVAVREDAGGWVIGRK